MYLNGSGEKVGVLKVRLYRPFDVHDFLAALPVDLRTVAVLDRTKEPGSIGEPLYLDVVAALVEGWSEQGRRCAGRRRSSAAAMACPPRSSRRPWSRPSSTSWPGREPKHHFTVGINDDVTHTSLRFDPTFDHRAGRRCGRSSTAWAPTALSAPTRTRSRSSARTRQLSPRATSSTTPRNPVRSPSRTCGSARGRSDSTYLISRANFVACHQFSFLETFDVLRVRRAGRDVPAQQPLRAGRGLGPSAARGAGSRSREEADVLRHRRLRWPAKAGHGRAHQHHHADLLLRPQRRAAARAGDRRHQEGRSRRPTARRAARSCATNFAAVDHSLAHLHEVQGPGRSRPRGAWTGCRRCRPRRRSSSSGCTALMIAGEGDQLPVSALPVDGTFPTGTARWEKRNIALKSRSGTRRSASSAASASLVCPHAVIRAKVFEPACLAAAPAGYQVAPTQRCRNSKDVTYTLPGRARGLHRLPPVRRGLPGQGQEQTPGTRRST